MLLGRWVPPSLPEAAWSRIRRLLLAPSSSRFAAAAGLLAASLSLWVSVRVLARRPPLLDGVSQLVHARYLAGGRLAGPQLQDPEFWQFQFMVLGEAGWVSQYPPGFPALLAVGMWMGAPWLVGPAALGVAVALTALIAERLFPDDPVVARSGAALAVSSPVLLFHAGAYMSHALALAGIAAAMYASLRAVDGSWRWTLLSGAGAGVALATRPLAGLVLGAFATLAVWLWAPGGRRTPGREWTARLLCAGAGAAPFVLFLLLYNHRFFGSPARFGYEAAEGPGHRLGFHVDPWGSPYGPLEGLGYTSADLQGLSLELLHAPVPALLLVALWLLLAPRLGAGVRLAAAWALLPVAAHFFYWHHDLFMGPRLLYEGLPGWMLLLAASAAGLLRALPDGSRRPGWRRPLTRRGLGATLLLAMAVAVGWAAPRKLASYRALAERSGMMVEAPRVARASLVFVHGTWEDRLAARLAAGGMRVDSIRLALAHTSTCRLELHVTALETGEGLQDAPPLVLGEGRGPPLRVLQMPSGSVIRAYEGEALADACEREAASDFEGVVGLPPLLWQGALPGLGEGGAMFVRDMGPERNARLLERFPDREPLVFRDRGGALELVPYPRGMAELWPEGP